MVATAANGASQREEPDADADRACLTRTMEPVSRQPDAEKEAGINPAFSRQMVNQAERLTKSFPP
jgi:hypothetical protein